MEVMLGSVFIKFSIYWIYSSIYLIFLPEPDFFQKNYLLYIFYTSQILLILKDSLDLICKFRLETFLVEYNFLSYEALSSFSFYFVHLSHLTRNDIPFEAPFFLFFLLIIIVFDLIKTMQKIIWNIHWGRNIVISNIRTISIFNFRPFYQKLLSDLLNRNISSIHYFCSISLRMAAGYFFYDWVKLLHLLDLFKTDFVQIVCSTSISSHEFSWELVFKFNSENCFSINELLCCLIIFMLLIFRSYILNYYPIKKTLFK